MPINREPESLDDHAPEESAVRRAPLDQDDAYELADHEYTLVADADDSRGWPYDEHTAPWSTLPPLPPWATKARALLEPPTLPRPLNDETPTLVEEGGPVSATALRALRMELEQSVRTLDARAEQIEQLERSLASAVQARAEAELRNGMQSAELQGRVQGQALRIADLEEELREMRAAREAREARFASELRELIAARDASEAELQEDVRQLRAARDAREAELEEEVRELKAVHEVRAAALEELRAENAALEKRIAELKSTKKARAAELEHLRESDAAKTARISALEDQVRQLESTHATRVAELESAVRELEAARETSMAELERLRESYAVQATRVIELEHQMRQPAPLEVATGIASDSEVDIETTVEWITNAPPGLEVTIEVDAHDETDVVVAPPPADPTDAPQLEASVAPLDTPEEPVAPEPQTPVQEAVDSDVFDAAPPASPETTIEIDPDSDLFELDAAMPPPAPIAEPEAASGKPRKKRQTTKARKSSPTGRDDLKQIDGIGKGLEQRLYAKGIRTYAQLAALRPADVARLAERIGVSPERIASQSWIPQARRLKQRTGKSKTAKAPKPRKRTASRA